MCRMDHIVILMHCIHFVLIVCSRRYLICLFLHMLEHSKDMIREPIVMHATVARLALEPLLDSRYRPYR